jgi:hypothetical protein
MAQDEHDLLELLKFELNVLEDAGYERSPHRAWRPARTNFEPLDSSPGVL